jgi:predicted RNA-binding protein YlqC (UPF0109 family)
MDLEKLLVDIVSAIVDTPDEVKVVRNENGNNIEFTLSVAPDEMGMVIGRGGKIAKGIRTVVKAASASTGKKVTVDIR